MTRRNQILAGVLALQILVVAFIFWPRPAASTRQGESLLPGVEADRITGLTITDGTGRTIQLARRSDGWTLPTADDYPCLQDEVSTLLTKTVELTTDRLVTETPDSHKRLKVAESEFERRIDLELDDGTQHRLYIGTSPSFGAAHVRVDDQNEVYLAPNLSPQDAAVEATAWADRVYFSAPRDQLVAMTLRNGNGLFELRKEGDAWTLDGLAADETFRDTTAQTLISRATSVAMLRPLGKEEKDTYGMQQPSAVVTIQTQSTEEGDKTYTIWVGAQDPAEKSYVVRSSESPYYVQVREFAVQDFVEKTRDDFLELPPTPTPEATPSS